MKCEEVQLNLPGLLFEELAPAEKERLLSHLEACPGCRQEWQELKATRSILAELPDEKPPSELVFVSRGKTRIWSQVKGWLTAPGIVRWGLAAALVLVALSLAQPNLSYRDGDFALTFGRGSKNLLRSTQALAEQFQAERVETLLLVSQLLAENAAQQRQEMAYTLAVLFRDLDSRWQNNLLRVEKGLEDVHRSSQFEIMRTNLMIEDFITNPLQRNDLQRR